MFEAVLLVASLLFQGVSVERSGVPTVAGTYDIEIRSSADPESVDATIYSGTIVLDSALFEADEIPEPASCCLEVGHKNILAPFNGCFVLESHYSSSVEDPEIVEVLKWHEDDTGAVSFNLFQSVDAGYAVTVHRASNGLMGQAVQYHAAVDYYEISRDVVRMRRVGNADLSVCYEAASARVPIVVDLRDVIANPAIWDGRYVAVRGVAEYECTGERECGDVGTLWVSNDARKRSDPRASVRIHTQWLGYDLPRRLNVIGRYYAPEHSDESSGDLRNVSRWKKDEL